MFINYKFIGTITLLLAFVSSCSSTKERKPFMVVSKVETPSFFGNGISVDYDIGHSNMKGDALKTKFKGFTYLSLSSSVGAGFWKNDFGMMMSYNFRYSFYSKDQQDPNNENKTITVESFKSLNNRFIIGASKEVFRNRLGTSFGISASYYPYNETRYYSVNSLPNRRYYAHGTGYGAGFYFSIRNLGCDLGFRSLTYVQDLSEKITSFGCGISTSLF